MKKKASWDYPEAELLVVQKKTLDDLLRNYQDVL